MADQTSVGLAKSDGFGDKDGSSIRCLFDPLIESGVGLEACQDAFLEICRCIVFVPRVFRKNAELADIRLILVGSQGLSWPPAQLSATTALYGAFAAAARLLRVPVFQKAKATIAGGFWW